MTLRRRIRRAKFPYNLQEFQRELQRIGGDNLIAYWPLDDQSGTWARDLLERLGAELLSNTGFETAGTGDPDFWANWTESASDGALVNETTLVYHGADAAKITAGSSTDTHIYQDITTVAGDYYKLVFLTRGDGTYDGRYQIYDNDNSADILATTATGVTGTSYTVVTAYFNSPAGCTSARIYCHCPSTDTGIAYFDDVSVREVLAGEYLDIVGCTLGQKGPPQLGRSHYSDGINDADSQVAYDDETGSSWGAVYHGLSLADGVAFIRVEGVDLSTFAGAEGSDTPYMIVLTDDAGSKVAWGYLGNQEAAESLGSELVTDGSFETSDSQWDNGDLNNWTKDNAEDDKEVGDPGTGSTSLKVTTSAANGGMYQGSISVVAGKLYKLAFVYKNTAADVAQYRVYDEDNTADIIAYTDLADSTSWSSAQALYFTAPSGCSNVRLYLAGKGNGDIVWFDSVSIKEVLHAGTDAVHIISAKDGSTRNWAGIESGFDYNDSTYTFEVRKTLFQITGALTVGAWVKPSDTSSGTILSKLEYKWGYWIYQYVVGPIWKFEVMHDTGWDVNTAISATAPVAGVWVFLVGVYSPGSFVRIYVNGRLEATDDSVVASIGDTAASWAIGARIIPDGSVQELYCGNIAHAFACDKVLSTSQIKRLYDIGKRAHSG